MSVLDDCLSFRNGRAVKAYSQVGNDVWGSNGVIGSTEAANASAGDIVIGRVGAFCGSLYLLTSDSWVTDNAIVASPKSGFDSQFVYYVLTTLPLREHAGGSAQPLLNQTVLRSVECGELPDLPIQRRIAEILGRLDDKIEVNRRINRTLEAMAQALYRRWFVDFGPFQDGEFVKSEVGLVPKGWEVKALGDLVDIEVSVVNPQSYPDETFNHFSIPAFDERRLPIVEQGAAVKSGKYLIQSDRVLVSKLNPVTHRVWTVFAPHNRRSFSSTEFIHYVCRSPLLWSFVNGYMRSQAFVDEFRAHVAGTTGSRQRVSPSVTLMFKLVLPPAKVLSDFDSLVSPYLTLFQKDLAENEALAATRDYLLPRLLAGKVI